MRPDPSKRRRIPLGERLTIVEKIRRGEATIAWMSSQLAIPEAQIMQWLRTHKDERWTCVSDVLSGGAVAGDLQRRARRLLQLVDDANVELRLLHQRLFAVTQANGPRRPRGGSFTEHVAGKMSHLPQALGLPRGPGLTQSDSNAIAELVRGGEHRAGRDRDTPLGGFLEEQ